MSPLTSATDSLGKDVPAAPKPVVIGLYGIPGSGKSFLLQALKEELDQSCFEFYEGSEAIANLVPGGLEAFQDLPHDDKVKWRAKAIDAVGQQSVRTGRTAIVAGHFMFWSEAHKSGDPVYTPNDLQIFTHIVYLGVEPEEISRRRLRDKLRNRPEVSVEHLRCWQLEEIARLRRLCSQHGILFLSLRGHNLLPQRLAEIMAHFRNDTAATNMSNIEVRLDRALPHRASLHTALVMDADRTLAAEDTGSLFWETLRGDHRLQGQGSPLTELFGSLLGYSDPGFRQATLLYEEAASGEEYERLCETVAASVKMYPDFVSLLRSVEELDDVGAVVITCGLGRVWQKVLEREGLSGKVQVVGGGRLADKFVVTPKTKADIVAKLRQENDLFVWAFGDSPMDLPMLREADEAVVVVGHEQTRSWSMEAALLDCIRHKGLLARQVLQPDSARLRLDENVLPQMSLRGQDFLDSVRYLRLHASKDICQDPELHMLHATGKAAAKLLMSPTRDAAVTGPLLREKHQSIGRYLATEYLSQILGLEEYSIPHVQGHQVSGYKISNESSTSIVALMRGGEAMAFGVNDVLSSAMFVHASSPLDVKTHHLQNQNAVVLVDSVINSGKTILQFIRRVRHLHDSIRVVVVAGVVQAGAVSHGHELRAAMARYGAKLVALRLSENKFTGTKATDTGNRLYNTIHLA